MNEGWILLASPNFLMSCPVLSTGLTVDLGAAAAFVGHRRSSVATRLLLTGAYRPMAAVK